MDNTHIEIGDYIRSLREARGWGVNKLALMSGVSNAEISRIENKERKRPHPDTLIKIARALNHPVEEFYRILGYLDASGVAEKSAEYSPSRARPDTFAAWRPTGYDQLTPEQQREVDEFIAYVRHKYGKGGQHDRGGDKD